MRAWDDTLRTLAAPLVPDESVVRSLLARARDRRATKGQLLHRNGEVADALFFVRAGLLRYYYLADGVEHTGQFFDAGTFVADLGSFATATPGSQNVDALEPTEITVIPRDALLLACDRDHACERFVRRLIERAAVGSQQRSAALLLQTPTERYERLMAARPGLASRVPQYVIASYLGITPEALSRLRKRLAD